MGIKAIVFDIGDVILREDARASREVVSKKFNLDSSKFREYAKRRLADSYIGLDYVSFFKGLIDENNLNTTPEEMAGEWRKARIKNSCWILKNKELLEKLNEHYLTVSLTNSTKINDSIEIRKEAYKLFKINIVSHEVGLKKPDVDIYQLLLDKLEPLGIKNQEIVFIDDKQENLLPAETLGINVVLFNENEDLKKELNKLGVVV